MVHVQRTFTVDRPREVVLPFLADFANAKEWDPGTVSCDPITPPPVTEGSQWRNVSSLLGRHTELIYTLTTLAEDRVVLTGRNDTATSVDDISVRGTGSSSEITYAATVTLNGLARLAEPALQLLFVYLGITTERQMKRVINRL